MDKKRQKREEEGCYGLMTGSLLHQVYCTVTLLSLSVRKIVELAADTDNIHYNPKSPP